MLAYALRMQMFAQSVGIDLNPPPRIAQESVLPQVIHLEGNDFAAVIKSANAAPGFTATDCEDYTTPPLTVGFARHTVMSVAEQVVAAAKSGALKHIFVIGGCDGSEGERNYFRDLAQQSPKDTIILTLGCGKYRINQLKLGDIALTNSTTIPRLLDMGQCNDAYSAIEVAIALAKALKTDVNSLPLSLALSWFEQKAVAVLLTLLHLGIRNVRIGPNLPGFATPNMLKALSEKFNLMKCETGAVHTDLKAMMANK